MTAIPLTATVDDIDGLLVHVDTGRDEGALFWSWDDNHGSVINQMEPPNTSHRYAVPGTYNIHVHAENGDEAGVDVTVPGAADHRPNPTVPLAPNTGPIAGGTPITIHGTNLTGVAAVRIGSTPCTAVVVVDDTTVTAVTPGHTAGLFDVVFVSPGGTGAIQKGYTYV